METLLESRRGEVPAEIVDAGLVIAVDCERPGRAPWQVGLRGVREVILGRGAERRVDRQGDVVRVSIDDGRMSTVHARLTRGPGGSWRARDEGSKNGTVVDGEAIETASVSDGVVIEVGRTLMLFRQGVVGVEGERVAAVEDPLDTFCEPLAERLARAAKVAASTVPVVLLGETGTGKEVVARAIHARSGRAGPFIGVNCGALPEGLVEAELFGAEAGAYSGATERREGLVKASDGGTLFLDEIGELPASAQAALLRVLQEREVRPLGAPRAVPVDLRVVAATLRDLDADVRDGRFRDDLYARLAGLIISLPPLRERRADLGTLVARLVTREGDAIRLDRVAARALFAHDWPHNVRELENALRTAAALAGGAPIELSHLPEPVRAAMAAVDAPPDATADRELRSQLDALLGEHRGNVAAVARALGRAPMQIYRWMRRLNIDPNHYRA